MRALKSNEMALEEAREKLKMTKKL